MHIDQIKHYVVLGLFMTIWIGFIFYQNYQTLTPGETGGKKDNDGGSSL